MALSSLTTSLVVLTTLLSTTTSLTTCPGFPGYCSESFPGFTCNVVCSVGRNNVPLCQEDGTWTDIPRCIEHDPGVEEQIPGLCPGIPGYCPQSFLNGRCKFDCRGGPDIDSICSADGTWAPYPTCQGDVRDTQDGCDGCPGPQGGSRNRTAEILVSRNTVSDKRVPKIVKNDGGRKTVPSFAGNINIGRVVLEEKTTVRPVPSTTKRTPVRLSPSVKRTPVQSTIRRPGEQQQSGQSLFDQIKNRISGSQQGEKTKPTFRRPQAPPASFQTAGPTPGTFGVFEAVNLGGGPSPSSSSQGEFFGVFETVDL